MTAPRRLKRLFAIRFPLADVGLDCIPESKEIFRRSDIRHQMFHRSFRTEFPKVKEFRPQERAGSERREKVLKIDGAFAREAGVNLKNLFLHPFYTTCR